MARQANEHTTRMIYPIVKFGDPVLEKPAEPVTEFDDDLKKLVDDMFESMYAAHGVGLAAPQIGISQAPRRHRRYLQGRSRRQAGACQSGDHSHRGPSHPERRLPEHSRVSRAGDARAQGHRARAGRERASGSRRPAKTCWRAPFCTKPITSTASSTSATSAP